MPDWDRILPNSDHRWTMGLRRSETLQFLVPQDPDGQVLVERAQWLDTDPKTYAACLPEAEPTLVETVALARRFGAQIDTTAAVYQQLLGLGRFWDFDFVWMHPSETGPHRVVGGVVCFPSSWALGDKLGGTMSETHAPVPGLNQALDRSIESFFTKMEPGVIWERENMSYSRVPDLNQHPSRPRPQLDATVTPAETWIRLEHQALLKLDRSGSILFGIRVEVVPLTELPLDAAGRLARLFDTMSDDAACYKHLSEAREMLIPWLRGIRGRSPESHD
jgi:hypothetical protein